MSSELSRSEVEAMIAPHIAAVEDGGWVVSETAVSTRGKRWDFVKSARVLWPVGGAFMVGGIWYSLEKPRVRVRAPTERISMEQYRHECFMVGAQWTEDDLARMEYGYQRPHIKLNRIMPHAPVP